MSGRLRLTKLVARDHEQAYDMIASHFSDPALMANRDAKTNQRKLGRVADLLPVTNTTDVLDIGPGDGTLLRLLAPRVATCTGVDPSAAAIERLTELLADIPNVRFSRGTVLDLPFPDGEFDIVVVNSVLHMLPSIADVRNGFTEAIRVCRPGGHVWVGELPFRPELDRGIARHLARHRREYGLRNLSRLLYHVYLRPIVRGEPLLLYPAQNQHVPREELERWCRGHNAEVTCCRHQELARESETRNDYLIRIDPR